MTTCSKTTRRRNKVPYTPKGVNRSIATVKKCAETPIDQTKLLKAKQRQLFDTHAISIIGKEKNVTYGLLAKLLSHWAANIKRVKFFIRKHVLQLDEHAQVLLTRASNPGSIAA